MSKKDFLKNHEQMFWQFAVERHTRMQDLLKFTKNPAIVAYCEKTIAELEERYPQLKVRL